MSTLKIDAKGNETAVNLTATELEAALSADSSVDDIETIVKAAPASILFNLSVFTDGRVFSLIRHARYLGYTGEIIVTGGFALDQANYFIKSGASAFIVPTEQAATLKKTLTDLASAYDGSSVSRLPLFG